MPGPRQPGRIVGAAVEQFLSVGPLTFGAGVNITVWSCVDQLNIGVLADDATFDDPHELTDAMVEAFGHIRQAAAAAANVHEFGARWHLPSRRPTGRSRTPATIARTVSG